MNDTAVIYRDDFKLWWPAYDDRAESTHRTLINHSRHARAINKHCPLHRRRLAVQAGGFVGLWPTILKQHFSRVLTLEPDPASYEALRRNCAHIPKIMHRFAALSNAPGLGYMLKSKASCWKLLDGVKDLRTAEAIPIELMSIDSLHLPHLDALLLDVEGSELSALSGARETIARCEPVIQLEVWDDNRLEYDQFMLTLGYRAVETAGHDIVYVKIKERA